MDTLTVKGRNPEYQDPQYITPLDDKPKKLRFWQTDAFKRLKNKSFSMICAFCGSGKSILQVALGIHDIVKSFFTQKQLYVVPQSHIHKGFVGDGELDFLRIVIGGKTYEWVVKHNFCDERNKKVLKELKKWLLTDPKELSKQCTDTLITGLVAVASHQALGRVWKRLTEAERKKAIKNLSLRFDEFHHGKGIVCDEDDSYSQAELAMMQEEATTMGNICSFMMNNQEMNCKICGTTATPYRGDRSIILSDAVSNQFTFYYLDWIEHFKTLGIEEFTLEYEEYKRSPINQVIAKIKKEPNEKHMVVIPSSTHKWRVNGKDEIEELLNKIYKVCPKERVLDLVTPRTQRANKNKLLKEPKSEYDGESKYDVVVTCMLGREGTDWCSCSRLHNTSTENSVTLAVQTLGRPFRRFKGKRYVRIYHYVPEFQKPKKGMSKHDLLADRTNALLVCMQLDEMTHPILLPVITKSTGSRKRGKMNEKRMSLVDIFGEKYTNVKDDLINKIESLEEKTSKNIDAVIAEILGDYDVPSKMLRGVKDALRVHTLRILSPELKELGIDIKFMRREGFNKLIEKYDIETQSIFFKGEYSAKDWEVIRGILKDNWEEWVAEAKRATAAGRWSVRK